MSSSKRGNTRERNPRPRQSETPREDRPSPSYRGYRTRPLNFSNQMRLRTHVRVQRPCVPALIPTDPFLGPWPSQYPPNYYQQYRVRSSHYGLRPRGSFHQRNERPTAQVTTSTSYQAWRNTLWPNPQYLRGAAPPRFPLLVDELDMPCARGPRGEIPNNNRHFSPNLNPRPRFSHDQQFLLRPRQGRPNPIPPSRTEAEREQRARNYWARVNRQNPAPGTSTGVHRSESRKKKDLTKVNRCQAKPIEDTSSSSSDTLTLTPKKQHKSKSKKKTSHKTDSNHSSSADYPTWEDLSHKSSYSDSDIVSRIS